MQAKWKGDAGRGGFHTLIPSRGATIESWVSPKGIPPNGLSNFEINLEVRGIFVHP